MLLLVFYLPYFLLLTICLQSQLAILAQRLARNNAYREDNADLEHLPWEIEQMEKYYFYENISYNFQPNLIYKAMAKGLGIKEEREELSKQIKESAKKEAEEKKEKESRKFDHILSYAAIFAVFSIIWDFFPYLMLYLAMTRMAILFWHQCFWE